MPSQKNVGKEDEQVRQVELTEEEKAAPHSVPDNKRQTTNGEEVSVESLSHSKTWNDAHATPPTEWSGFRIDAFHASGIEEDYKGREGGGKGGTEGADRGGESFSPLCS